MFKIHSLQLEQTTDQQYQNNAGTLTNDKSLRGRNQLSGSRKLASTSTPFKSGYKNNASLLNHITST